MHGQHYTLISSLARISRECAACMDVSQVGVDPDFWNSKIHQGKVTAAQCMGVASFGSQGK